MSDSIAQNSISTSDLVSHTKKPSLFGAITELQNIIGTVQDLAEDTETPEQLDEIINQHLPMINEAKELIQNRVDARIYFIENLTFLVDKIKKEEEDLQKRRRILENLKERIKDNTKFLMENNPEIPFVGSKKKFAIQNNGGKQAITYQMAFRSFDHVLTDENARLIEDEFKEVKTITVLKKAEFDEAIRNGLPHPFAELEPRGTHLRIR